MKATSGGNLGNVAVICAFLSPVAFPRCTQSQALPSLSPLGCRPVNRPSLPVRMSDEARRPRPSLVDNDIVFNVALGSNMDGEKLRARATSRDGKNIEPLGEGVACRIEDWELSFQYLVLPPTEPVSMYIE